MLENQLIIEKKSNRKKIFENCEKKWIIDLGDRIKDWDDLYNIIQKEMDILGYDKQFGKSFETYHDIVSEEELFKKMQQENKNELIILYDYNSKLKDKDYIYNKFMSNFLLEWYRDLRIMFKREVPYVEKITVKVYFFVDDELLKDDSNSFNNRFIIATESDIEKFKKIDKNKDFSELSFINEIENRERFVDVEFERQKRFKDGLDKISCLEQDENQKKVLVFIKNFDALRFTDRYNLWRYMVENILIKKFIEGEEADIYAVFTDNIW